MLWTWALRKLPWTTLLAHAPTIVDAARNVYATTRKPAADGTPSARWGDGIERLRRAVEELETREAKLAKQVQTMATALEVLRARVLFALVGAALALVVAVVTAAVLLWR